MPANRLRYVSGPAPRKERPSRAQKAEEVREALFRAAAEVVGECGYAEASVSKITARANVAQGTFYNYFASRQDLLDQLLPVLGCDMLDYIRAKVGHCANELEREERRFRAFFDYLREHPEFHRILNEAEFFAPAGHREHFALIAKDYQQVLSRARARREIGDYDERDLEVLVYILMAARSYLSLRYTFKGETARRVPDHVVRAYAKFVAGGLLYRAPASARAAAPAARRRR